MEKKTNGKNDMRRVGIFMTIPFVLAIPPIIGWLIGGWLDKNLDTHPYLSYLLLFLGFVAGSREVYRLIRKYGNGV